MYNTYTFLSLIFIELFVSMSSSSLPLNRIWVNLCIETTIAYAFAALTQLYHTYVDTIYLCTNTFYYSRVIKQNFLNGMQRNWPRLEVLLCERAAAECFALNCCFWVASLSCVCACVAALVYRQFLYAPQMCVRFCMSCAMIFFFTCPGLYAVGEIWFMKISFWFSISFFII